MQIILCFLSYLILVLQYKLLAGKGAKDLTGVLLKNGSLQLLNKRTIATIPLMLLCIVFYSTDNHNHFLQAAWSEKAGFQTTLLVSICLLVSVYSTDQFKKKYPYSHFNKGHHYLFHRPRPRPGYLRNFFSGCYFRNLS